MHWYVYLQSHDSQHEQARKLQQEHASKTPARIRSIINEALRADPYCNMRRAPLYISIVWYWFACVIFFYIHSYAPCLLHLELHATEEILHIMYAASLRGQEGLFLQELLDCGLIHIRHAILKV